MSTKSIPTITMHKMHAQGNDFILVFKETLQRYSPKDFFYLLERRTGIGADGLIIAQQDKQKTHLQMFNQDHSQAAFCLNALYAVQQFLKDFHISPHPHLTFGPISVQSCPKHPERMLLDLTHFKEKTCAPMSLSLEQETLLGHFVDNENPHYIFASKSMNACSLERIGKALNTHPSFPEGVNVSCFQKRNNHCFTMRTYERGVGLTLSCGSAALAVLRATHTHSSSSLLQLKQPGGTISFHKDVSIPNTIAFSGQYTYVASIAIAPPSL